MAKEKRTAEEIEATVMAAVANVGACESLTGVTIGSVADDRVPFTWQVTYMHNCRLPECEAAIEQVVAELQKKIDLKG